MSNIQPIFDEIRILCDLHQHDESITYEIRIWNGSDEEIFKGRVFHKIMVTVLLFFRAIRGGIEPKNLRSDGFPLAGKRM